MWIQRYYTTKYSINITSSRIVFILFQTWNITSTFTIASRNMISVHPNLRLVDQPASRQLESPHCLRISFGEVSWLCIPLRTIIMTEVYFIFFHFTRFLEPSFLPSSLFHFFICFAPSFFLPPTSNPLSLSLSLVPRKYLFLFHIYISPDYFQFPRFLTELVIYCFSSYS